MILQITDWERQQSVGAWFPHGLIQALLEKMKAASNPDIRRQSLTISEMLEEFYKLALEQTSVLDTKVPTESSLPAVATLTY